MDTLDLHILNLYFFSIKTVVIICKYNIICYTKPRRVYSLVKRIIQQVAFIPRDMHCIRTVCYCFGKTKSRVDYGTKGVAHSKLLLLVFLQESPPTQNVLMKG